MFFLHKSTDRLEEGFKRIANMYPNKIAVSYNLKEITYSELDSKSDILAQYILSRKRNNTEFVGILMNRSIDMIISIFGVLKAGLAYVPIDPINNPKARINNYVAEIDLDLILSNVNIAIDGVEIINLNIFFFENEIIELSNNDIKKTIDKVKSAYMIFTSGTTGKPKGVVIEHCNVMSLYQNSNNTFGFTNNDVWTLFHSIAFDFSVWEIWGALLFGGKLVIVPNAVAKNVARFYNFLRDNQITVLNQTPQAFINLSKIDQLKESKLSCLRYVILGGEKLSVKKLEPWVQKNSFSPKIINGYGVTEATIFTTFKELKKENFIDQDISPIGEPVAGSSVILINEEGNIDCRGEMHVSGYGVSKGYINREELTNNKFINIEVNGEPLRVYKTGDLAFEEKGEFYYIKRIDSQIKFHGYRIELEEIEKVIELNSKIIKSIVILDNDRLLGYIESSELLDENEKQKLIKEVEKNVKELLPFYMMPSKYFVIDTLPLTINGKINYKELKNSIV
jgi:amino acid adenylation domain-containing protein